MSLQVRPYVRFGTHFASLARVRVVGRPSRTWDLRLPVLSACVEGNASK